MNGNSRTAKDSGTSGAPRPILMLEPGTQGHRLYYLRILALHAGVKRRVDLYVNPEAIGAPELEGLPPSVRIVGRLPESGVYSVGEVKQLAVETGASAVVVPDGDYLAIRLGLCARWPRGGPSLSVLIMREPRLERVRVLTPTWIRLLVKRALITRSRRLAAVNAYVLRSMGDRARTRFRTVQDPVHFRPTPDLGTFRQERSLDGSVFWFSIVGAITARKSVGLVAEAVAALAKEGKRVGLLIAGVQQTDALPDIEHARAMSNAGVLQLAEFNERLADQDLDSYIAISDCVVLAHMNEGPSGILGKAVEGRRPVVAAGAVSLREDVTNCYSRGGIWVPLEKDSLASAFREMYDGAGQETSISREASSRDEDIRKIIDDLRCID